jgi:hypothetical protein
MQQRVNFAQAMPHLPAFADDITRRLNSRIVVCRPFLQQIYGN